MKLFEGAAAINKEIGLIKNAGKKLDERIQVAGVSVIAHCGQHNDVTVVNNLFLAMPAGARKKALAEWLLKFGNVAANTDKASSKTAPFVYAKDKQANVEGAIAEPWYDFAPEPAVATMFDFQAMLASLLKKAEKAEQQGLKIEGAEALAAVRKLAKAKA